MPERRPTPIEYCDERSRNQADCRERLLFDVELAGEPIEDQVESVRSLQEEAQEHSEPKGYRRGKGSDAEYRHRIDGDWASPISHKEIEVSDVE